MNRGWDKPHIVLDFETVSSCDLKKAGAWRYAEDPTTAVLCLTWRKNDGTHGSWTPGQPFPFMGCEHYIYVAHNAAFEKAIWRIIMVPVYGWPDVPNSRWSDTMAACAARSLPQELERAASALELPHQKDMEGRRLVLSLSKPNRKGVYPEVTDDVLRRAVAYCQRDTDAELALLDRVRFLSPREALAWQLDQKINERGLLIDLDFVRAAKRVVAGAMEPLKREFAEITGGLAVGQRDKVLGWLVANGLYVKDLTKESLAEVMGDEEAPEDDDLDGHIPSAMDADLQPAVRRALDIRRLVGSSSLKKLDRFLDCVSADGRVRGSIAYHSAAPGRWGGRLFQPQNFPRGVVMVGGRKPKPDLLVSAIKTGDHEYVRSLLGEPIDVVVSALRHAIVADRGRVLLSGDYAGIQARTTLAIAGQHDKTAMMAAGQDVYVDMASSIYGYPVDKNKEPEKRQVGKNSVLGLGFQMGARKFQWKYARSHPLLFCNHVVRTYREDWAPRVRELWFGLEVAAKRALSSFGEVEARSLVDNRSFGINYVMRDGWLICRVPTGGEIYYYKPRLDTQTKEELVGRMGLEEYNKLVALYEAEGQTEQDLLNRKRVYVWTMKQGRWIQDQFFGGMLTQNVVTRVEVDMIVKAGILCEQNGFPIVLTVHDELIAEPLACDADEKAFEQIMLTVDDAVHAMGVPVAVETWKGDRYKK